MKLPNVLSVAVILAIAAMLEYIASGADQIVPVVWVPVVMLLLTGVAKALQVYAESTKAANPEARAVNEPQPQPGKVRRWLLD